MVFSYWGFPGGSDSKESACNAGDLGSIPGLGKHPGEENSNPLQYSCLENPMDKGAWRATVPGVARSQTWLTHSHFSFPILIHASSYVFSVALNSVVGPRFVHFPCKWRTLVLFQIFNGENNISMNFLMHIPLGQVFFFCYGVLTGLQFFSPIIRLSLTFLCSVAQWCLTFCDPLDCSLPSFSV